MLDSLFKLIPRGRKRVKGGGSSIAVLYYSFNNVDRRTPEPFLCIDEYKYTIYVESYIYTYQSYITGP